MDTMVLVRVLDVSRRMAELRAFDPLLVYVVDEAIKLVGAERGYLVLPRPDGTLDFRVARDRDGREVQHAQDQISTTVLNKVVQSCEPLVLHDAMSDSHFGHSQSVVALSLRSVMCAPLVSHGEAIGAIYVENRSVRGRFREEDLTPLVLFANQAAAAIENAALNDDLEARVADRTREIKEAASQLEKSWAEAVEANRLRTVLLGYVAHDLRSPLHLVVAPLELLQDETLGPLNAEQKTWITRAVNAVQDALQLTNDLLDLTKIEAGGLALHPEPVAPNDLLLHVCQIVQGLRWPATVAFRTDIAPELPVICIDPIRIRQVLLNLITNAIKFTTQGSVTLHARYRPDPDEVIIGVSDTGEGILPDQIDKVFQRFQQFDKDSTRQSRGAGLGLAICRELVEKHGGRIWAESTPGVGSNFVFALPVSALAPPISNNTSPD